VEKLAKARPLVAGTAEGQAVVSREPLSFWGGYDYRTGEIIDRRHPLSGVRAAGAILALPYARGSSTTTAVLLEAVRAGTAPAAILTTGEDTFFALAAIVAEEMYRKSFCVAAIDSSGFDRLQSGQWLRLEEDGTIYLVR
jgi:hypothetical protein